MLITFIVNQVNFEAAVEYTVNSQALHRVKAYQAAKAGVELSLLRINLYNKAMNEFGKQLGEQAQMLNMIYSMPITWPMVIPDEVSSVDKESFTKISKEALRDSTYATQIQSEDLLNINDLDSPSENQRERIKTKIEELFKAKMENDHEWADKNRGIPYDEIINNIKDWIDPDTQSGNGGDESAFYSKVREMDPDNQDNYPPNRFFRTMDEVRMVPGVTDDVFNLISPAFSVFGPMGINPNLADQGALKSLHKSITDEIVGKIMSRRDNPNEGGPFKDAEDFFSYISREGARVTQEEQEKIPLRFTNPCNFRIQSTGSSGKSVITITAITYNIACAQSEVSAGITDEQNKKNGNNNQGNNNQDQTKSGSSTKQELPKGPPRIVYWNER
jgi:general secretion pathway protein K